MYELLSPAGNAERLKTAIYFGADAVYFAGKRYGLRAYSDNFEQEELKDSIDYCHAHNVKAYITLNIVARNEDFIGLDEYIKYLYDIKADAVIVSDIGIIERIRAAAPNLAIHVSTQANVINKYSAKFFCDLGVKRIILARELTLTEIKEIREFIPKSVELEAFVHGAMCISYSGRCLLSNYMSGRDSNRGECVQACRWQYSINEVSRKDEKYDICEDERGTYILNSKDLNMLIHLKDLIDAGVTAFKIEGRMKSPYYVATATNAYKRALNALTENKNCKIPKKLQDELLKTSHRRYTTGFYFKDKQKEESECLTSSMPVQTHEIMAIVLAGGGESPLVEQRNRFKVGDTLEVLSPTDNFNKKVIVKEMFDEKGESVLDAKNVQEKLHIKFDKKINLQAGDILRKQV